MNSMLSPQSRTRPLPDKGKSQAGDRSWKSYFRRTIVLVLVVSFAIHMLLLLAFGTATIFKGNLPKLSFSSQEIANDRAPEAEPPPPEDPAPQEEMAQQDPFAAEAAESSAAEESAPALDMLTVTEGARWAPTIPKNTPVSETGVIGGTGKGTGTGTGTGTGKGGGPGSGKQLFGVTIKARKLGVVVSINKRAQSSGHLPEIFSEIFKEFPDSAVILTNGGGMMDWDKALEAFNQRLEEIKRKEKETGEKKFKPGPLEKPRVARFNTGEALDWVVIRGQSIADDYPGLRKKYPDLFDELRKRSNVWFITSYKDANASYLAFEELVKRGVEGIYWYNEFDSPIEGKAADEIAQKIIDSKIEILVQNQGTKVQGREWLEKVGAKFVK